MKPSSSFSLAFASALLVAGPGPLLLSLGCVVGQSITAPMVRSAAAVNDKGGGSRRLYGRQGGEKAPGGSGRRSSGSSRSGTGDQGSCVCNGNDDRAAAAIPPLDITKSDLTYPNLALEAAYIALSLVAGTGGEPHKVAMVGAAMYEAYAVFDATSEPLTKPGIKLKEELMGEDGSNSSSILEGYSILEEYVGYAAYGTLRKVLSSTPEKVALLDAKMKAIGFDSDAVVTHPSWELVVAVLVKYSLGPPKDFTPTNPPSTMFDADCDSIKDVNKWQAQCVQMAPGAPCTPQKVPFLPFYDAKLISSDGNRTVKGLVADLPLPPLYTSNGGDDKHNNNNNEEFIAAHLAVLEASATLDDANKFSAEFFQPNAALRMGMLTINEAEARKSSLEESIVVFFAVSGAIRDAVAGVVTVKLDYETARPLAVLQCQYRGKHVKAWRKPYYGVSEFTNDDDGDGGNDDLWRPYLQNPPFPGYISGHAGAAGAGAAVLTKFFAPDGGGSMLAGNNCAVQKRGMSRTEPKILRGAPGYMKGVTDVPNKGPESMGYSPAEDVTLCWENFGDFAAKLSQSRLLAGIHIKEDNDVGLAWGESVGDIFYDYVMGKMN